MELYDVMRTTFAARQFTDAPMPDDVIYRILENARFAPSGGNRQAGHVIIVRDKEKRQKFADLSEQSARRYIAQKNAGESPWNAVVPSSVDKQTIKDTPVPRRLTDTYINAAVVLVVCVDLRHVAAMDQDLDRIGMVAGASIYPLAWNILLAARNEGFGGTLTTLPIAEEPELRSILGIPEYMAVSALLPMGLPLKQLTKLKRQSVSAFTSSERWDGEPLTEA
ncbi:MAG: nitroreductase family protein [Pseudomonadales bacterium]